MAKLENMKNSASLHTYWVETANQTIDHAALHRELRVDVAVVGAGIAGLTAALLLARSGRTVAVLEAGRVAGGESSRTSAHLTVVQDLRFKELASRFGVEATKLVAQQGMTALSLIEKLSVQEEIDCQFGRIPGFLFSEEEKGRHGLEEEARAARQAGLHATFVEDVPLPWKVGGAVRFDEQAVFQPVSYVRGLSEAVIRHGGRIFEGSRVVSVDDGKPCKVETRQGRVIARDVIVATDSPISNRFFLHNKISPWRTYIVEGRVAEPLHGLFWDTMDPYHYIRTADGAEGPVAIVGGEDHRVGQVEDTAACAARLEAWARDRLDLTVDRRWSGQVNESADGLPYVGRNSISFHVYVATGFSGTGLSNGTIAGMILADTLLGHTHPLAKLFAATRIKPLASAREVLVHGAESAYHYLRDRIAPDAVSSVELVARGEGKIVRVRGESLAVHRDAQGDLHVVSPVCTHLGCHVHWNAGERTWDCPCHGSRFQPDGAVLHGPAVKALAARELPVEQGRPIVEGGQGPGIPGGARPPHHEEGSGEPGR